MMTKEMLNGMTVKELRTYVKDNNLQVAKVYELKKSELIEAIENAEIAKYEAENVSEIIKAEEACLDAEFGGFAPDMLAEAFELENSRTDYGTPKEEKTDTKRNGWEKIATKQLTNAYNFYIGGLENTLSDYSEDDEEYKNAYATLCSEEEFLIDVIYQEAMYCEYDEGFSGSAGSAPKEMKFAGREFCRNVIRDLIKKDGFCGYSANYPINAGNAVEEQKALDEVVANITEPKKRAAIPMLGKYINSKSKWRCPDCGNVMGNPDEFCGKCGLHLYYGDDQRYEDAEKTRENIGMDAKKTAEALVITKYGRTHKYCPVCNNRVDWEEDWTFCFTCGQKVE